MKRKTVIRLALLGVLMVSLALVAKFTPLGQYFNFERLSSTLSDAGPTGIVMFFVAFLAGALMNLPAALFTAIAFLVYDIGWGFPIAYVGAFIAGYGHFLVVRTIGGQALGEIKIPLMQKIMARFDMHPLRTVILLRMLFFISPPVNYLLALSNVRLRHFVLGTLIGNIVQIAFHATLMYFVRDWVLARLV